MDSSLLATKVRVPHSTQPLVARERLVDAIEHALHRHRLIVVSGPAGYGKTRLVAQWAGTSRFPIAWLSLDQQDNEFARFFRYLLMAWETIQPGINESTLGLLLSGISSDQEAVLTSFLNAAASVSGQMVFVLDDCHLIDDPAIYQALAYLLDHLPPNLHIVLAGRSEPPLPLARLRARREVFEIGPADLAFQMSETEHLLRDQMGFDLPGETIVDIQTRLEGWIAGLQLVSLSLRRHPETDNVPALRGQHRFIADYLSEDVVGQVSPELRRFLHETSILDQLSGPLCDAVGERTDSQAILERLERENLFVLPLDDRREWFRYHRVFADFLHQELLLRHAAEVADLHHRAARWYLDHEFPEQAFHHALAGDDVGLVAWIAESYLPPKMFGGEIKIVEQWLAAVPSDWYSGYPALGLLQVIYLVITGETVAGARRLDEVERQLRDSAADDRPRQLAKVSMLRCAIACFENNLAQAEEYAGQALRDLPDDDPVYRADTYHALGDTYRRHGLWDDAKTSYLNILALPTDPSSHVRLPHVLGAIADLELQQGRLRQAADYWRRALSAIEDRQTWGKLPLPVIGWVYLRLGELLYEWNDLDDAWDHLSRGLRRAELGGDGRALVAGYVIAARLKLTRGDVEGAEGFLEQARPWIEQATASGWDRRFERCQIDVWMARGHLRAVVEWSDAALQDETPMAQPDRFVARLTLAHVLAVKGDEISNAQGMEILDDLVEEVAAGGWLGVQIEALALRALFHWQARDQLAALTTIERALRLGESEGYVRLFADLGLPMARLLQEARSRAVMPDYVERLLAACDADIAHQLPALGTMPEPLSPRELEVLPLIAAGLTNREIADRLVISPETVKKHLANILAKLDASNRTEAAAKARSLNLLA